MKRSILQEKSEAFSVRIVNMSKHLVKEHREYHISDQVSRSGTSIAANIAEAIFAQSDADFIFKLHIALKEASETRNWIILLFKTGFITQREYESIYDDCIEIIKLLTHSINKVKRRIENRE